jgi:hypothetical protein
MLAYVIGGAVGFWLVNLVSGLWEARMERAMLRPVPVYSQETLRFRGRPAGK